MSASEPVVAAGTPKPEVDHWNYRIFAKSVPTCGGDFDEVHFIAEAYYDAEGNVVSYTDEPIAPQGDSLDSLLRDIGLMLKAESLPVLNVHELEALSQARDVPSIPRCPIVVEVDDSIGGEGDIACGKPLSIADGGGAAMCADNHRLIACACGKPSCRGWKVARWSETAQEWGPHDA